MNRPPSILVDTGFEVDRNGALTELVTPNVVATLNAPRKVTFNGTILSWLGSTAAALQEFSAPNITELNNNFVFNSYTALVTVSLPSVTSISVSSQWSSIFRYNNGLANVDLSGLQTTSAASTNGTLVFDACNGIKSLTLPRYVSNQGGCVLMNQCTGLEMFIAPVFQYNSSNGNGMLYACTGLKTVQLGSEGHPVTSLTNKTFNGCTQAGLTITIYTSDGNALANSPFGATNATIVYEEA